VDPAGLEEGDLWLIAPFSNVDPWTVYVWHRESWQRVTL
jgi:hypothetical protein